MFLNAKFLKHVFFKGSVESSVLTAEDVQKNGDMNVKTRVQIPKADQSTVEE